jgi:hypothetical protein
VGDLHPQDQAPLVLDAVLGAEAQQQLGQLRADVLEDELLDLRLQLAAAAIMVRAKW